MNAQDYGITIRRVIEEGEACFEARVRELPDVVEYADSHEEAYELAIDTIETTEEALKENGRAMPQPLAPADDFSGRITLRVPRTLHRALVSLAEDEGVSLNQQIVAVLSYYVGVQTPTRTVFAEWHAEPAIARPGGKAGTARPQIIHDIGAGDSSKADNWMAPAV